MAAANRLAAVLDRVTLQLDAISCQKKRKELQTQLKQILSEKNAIKRVTVLCDVSIIENKNYGALILQNLQCLVGLKVEMLPKEQAHCGIQCIGTIHWRKELPHFNADKQTIELHLNEHMERETALILEGKNFMKMVQLEKQDSSNVLTKRIRNSGPDMRFSQFKEFFCKSANLQQFILIIFDVARYVRKVDACSTAKSNSKTISYQDFEDALLQLQLDAHIQVYHVDRADELAVLVKSLTKTITTKDYREDRWRSPFTFCDKTNSEGVKIDTSIVVSEVNQKLRGTSAGSNTSVLPVNRGGVEDAWKKQLQQWRGLTEDFASAVVAVYPTARNLYDACQKSKDSGVANPHLFLENLEVRRGCGLLASSRRLGKELSKALYNFMIAVDPGDIID